MHIPQRRFPATLICTFCGREICRGEEYWACNGSQICPMCLTDFARRELAACHEIRGKEIPL